MKKWFKALALVTAGLAAGTIDDVIELVSSDVVVEMVEPPPYKILLVRDHGQAGRCGIEMPTDGSVVVDPRANEGPRWVRLQTEDGYVCDWKMPDVLPDCVFNAHGPTMDDVAVNCVYRFGDVNGDGDVDADDVLAVKAMNGQAVTHETCRYDLNTDGRINLIDAAAAKRR